MEKPFDADDSASTETASSRMLQIRAALVDRLWAGLAIVAFIGVPASCLRSIDTGWLPLYTFHIILGLLVVAIYALRARLPFVAKSALLLLVFWTIGIVGLVRMAFLGVGFGWLAMSSLLTATIYSVRAGIITAIAALVVIALAGVGFTSGLLTTTVDPTKYVTSPYAWTAVTLVVSVTTLVVFLAIAGFQRTTQDLLVEVEKQRDQIAHLAIHDQLTGLPSSDLADDRLQVALHAARRARKKVALLFIDLDGFKALNDTAGHAAGDHALKAVAERLKIAIRAEDTAARIGGDEFMVILGRIQDDRTVARIAERILDALSKPIDGSGGGFSVGASIGIGLFPDHADDPQTLRRLADAAMYVAKRTGKNRYAFADTSASLIPRVAAAD